MDTGHVYPGTIKQGDTPNWGPLLDIVGDAGVEEFMWMFEVELDDGTPLQAYKHIDTRRYLHLAADGSVFVYEPPETYRQINLAKLYTS